MTPKVLKVAASIMCANQLRLKEELDRLQAASVAYLHCDVMDGVFVENLAMAPYVLKQIKEYSPIPLDIHLAVEYPERYIRNFCQLNPEIISVHVESTQNLHRVLSFIREKGVKASVALNPTTPVSSLKEVISMLDMVLVMTVDPGFSGQRFIDESISKIGEVKSLARQKGAKHLLVEIDGNVNAKTIPAAVKAGANILVAGTSGLFRGEDCDYKELVRKMLKSAECIETKGR